MLTDETATGGVHFHRHYPLGRIPMPLGQCGSSTQAGLLQYLSRITVVLKPDYCSTLGEVLQYSRPDYCSTLGEVLEYSGRKYSSTQAGGYGYLRRGTHSYGLSVR